MDRDIEMERKKLAVPRERYPKKNINRKVRGDIRGTSSLFFYKIKLKSRSESTKKQSIQFATKIIIIVVNLFLEPPQRKPRKLSISKSNVSHMWANGL